MERRTFQHFWLLLLPVVYGAGIVTGALRFLRPLPRGRRQERLEVGSASEFTTTSEPKSFLFNRRKVWVLHDGSAIRAFDAECSHLACNVQWSAGEGSFRCNCHNAGFRRDGTVLRSPAREPLKEFDVEVSANGEEVVVLDRLKGVS